MNVIMALAVSCPGVPGLMKTSSDVIKNLNIYLLSECVLQKLRHWSTQSALRMAKVKRFEFVRIFQSCFLNILMPSHHHRSTRSALNRVSPCQKPIRLSAHCCCTERKNLPAKDCLWGEGGRTCNSKTFHKELILRRFCVLQLLVQIFCGRAVIDL